MSDGIRDGAREIATKALKKDPLTPQAEVKKLIVKVYPTADYYHAKDAMRWARKVLGIKVRPSAALYDKGKPLEEQSSEIRPHEKPDDTTMSMRGCKRLAADMIRDAWETASKRTGRDLRGSFAVRYSRAWLQTPKATATWCGLVDIDPDELAELSRQRHGVPRFSADEIRRYRKGELSHAVAYISTNGETKS